MPCAVLCIILVVATTACESSHASSSSTPSSTSPNRVVFDQTISSNLVTRDFILTGSQQTLAWSCDYSASGGGGSLLIYLGTAGSAPEDAQPIFKGICGISASGVSGGTDTLHNPPGFYFLRFVPGGSWHITLTDIDYAPSAATALARSGPPTATPYPTPPPFSPSVGYQTAWGTHAVTATFSMTPDSTHTFIPSAISPDGTMLLGNEKIVSNSPTPSVSIQGGYYDLTTRHFTAIGVSDGGLPVQCCATDGRFLMATDYTEPGAPFGCDGLRYWAYDLQTGRLRQLGKTCDVLGIVALTNGLVVYGSNVVNLATGTMVPLTAGPTNSETSVVTFSWPYLVYELSSSNGTPIAFRVRNLASNQDTLLASLAAFAVSHAGVNWPTKYSIVGDTLIAVVSSNQIATQANLYGGAGTTTFYALVHALSGGTLVTQVGSFTSEGSPGYTVANNTLYVSVLTGQVTGQLGIMQDIGWTTLYAIAQVASGGTTAQVVATFNGDALDIVGANSRVIACDGGVWDSFALREVAPVPVFWDLALQTFVSFATVTGGNFPQYPSPEGGNAFVIGLAGNELAVVQGNQTAQTVLLFHTE